MFLTNAACGILLLREELPWHCAKGSKYTWPQKVAFYAKKLHTNYVTNSVEAADLLLNRSFSKTIKNVTHLRVLCLEIALERFERFDLGRDALGDLDACEL
jgi:hypothetical protein